VRRDGTDARGGFTFVELLVTITIIAIMFGMGMGISQYFIPESKLSSVASDYAHRFEQTRLEAIISGRPTWLQIELGDNTSSSQFIRAVTEPVPGQERRTQDEDDPSLVVLDWQPVPPDVRIESVSIGEEVPLTHGRVGIPIQADGTAPSHLVRFWAPEIDPNLARETGWACVQVAGLLGQARVLNRYVEPEIAREDAFR
jgi:prepilin-type N-terminal cleavage/methylation domain-containing protein